MTGDLKIGYAVPEMERLVRKPSVTGMFNPESAIRTAMRVRPVNYNELEDEELRDIFASFPSNEGADAAEMELPNHFRAEAHFPEVMKAALETLRVNRQEGDLPRSLVRKLYLAVSMANDCGYCTGVYCTLLADEVGSSDAVTEFQRAVADGDLDGREGDILEFAIKLTKDPHAITDDDFERLRSEHGLSDKDFVQIVYIVNVISGYNRVTTAFDCEYEDQYHEPPWIGI